MQELKYLKAPLDTFKVRLPALLTKEKNFTLKTFSKGNDNKENGRYSKPFIDQAQFLIQFLHVLPQEL